MIFEFQGFFSYLYLFNATSLAKRETDNFDSSEVEGKG